MLWLKALHVVFVVTWFAGLFYLPRLLIYHVESNDPAQQAQFKIMERRLLGITHIGGLLAIGFGLATMAWWMHHAPGYLFTGGWFTVKLCLVAVLIAYHLVLIHLTRMAQADHLTWPSRKLRIFNEIPGLLLILIVIMVVVKPF